MTIEQFATICTVVVTSVNIYMAAYVVLRFFLAWRRGERKTNLPLHIWTIAISYVGLMVSLLTNERDFQDRFWIYMPSLLLGTFSLWKLSLHQNNRHKEKEA